MSEPKMAGDIIIKVVRNDDDTRSRLVIIMEDKNGDDTYYTAISDHGDFLRKIAELCRRIDMENNETVLN